MRFLVVVVLRQGDEVIAGVVTDLDLELVAVFDALDFFQCGVCAAALTRRRCVLQGITEFERRFGRDGLRKFHVNGRVERSERHGERVIAFECKAECFVLGGILHEGVSL